MSKKEIIDLYPIDEKNWILLFRKLKKRGYDYSDVWATCIDKQAEDAKKMKLKNSSVLMRKELFEILNIDAIEAILEHEKIHLKLGHATGQIQNLSQEDFTKQKIEVDQQLKPKYKRTFEKLRRWLKQGYWMS